MIADLTDRIAHLKRRLTALDDDCGSATPEAEAALLAFEARAKVRLPEEYRAFLSNIRRLPEIIPFYGMVPPGQAADEQMTPLPIEHLAKPFPFTETWIWEDDPEFSSAPKDWTAEMKKAAWQMIEHGILWLGTNGCALNFALIVTGTMRGEIWSIADVGMAREDPGGTSFLDWLEHKIRELEAKKESPWRNRSRWSDSWWSYVAHG